MFLAMLLVIQLVSAGFILFGVSFWYKKKILPAVLFVGGGLFVSSCFTIAMISAAFATISATASPLG